MLLQHDADVQAQNRIMGSSPLHSCINSSKEPFENRLSCAKLLVDHGADVHLKDLYGMTPLDYVDKGRHASKGEVDVINLLAMRDILESSDAQVLNLIPFLERNDLQGLVALLLEEDSDGGNDVDVQERDPKTGKTALILAIEEITKHEPSLSTQNDQDQERTEILVSIITLLLQKGADANAIPNKNIDDTVLEETLAPMYMICKALDAEYRHLLANFDIEVSETESMTDHQSKMFYQRTFESISMDLLGHGAQLSPCIMQMMHDAARRGNTGTIWFWIAHLKADPNTRGRQGMTPLHFAARSGKADVAELLLSFDGIDLTVVDDRGKTSMDAAVANGRQEVVDLLKAHCHHIS